MALVSLRNVCLTLGNHPLFKNLDLQIQPGEKTALIGRNGSGKTTLMKLLCAQLQPDSGQVDFARGIKTAYLPQEVPVDLKGRLLDIVLDGVPAIQKLLRDYHDLNQQLQHQNNPQLLTKLAQLQSEIDHLKAWQIQSQAETQIAKMRLNPQDLFEQLSGGQKKRALLARALMNQPDLLFLDEPTNHLDIESIQWLENFLSEYTGTLFFVTHDRVFMQNLANRITELDRGQIYSWNCSYKTFLERKQSVLETQAQEQAAFTKKLEQEEAWVRQGVKARRTRNQARVRELENLRALKASQRKDLGTVQMQLQEAQRSGEVVIKAEKLSFAYGDKKIVDQFSGRILRGDKIGLIGPNGSGKSTLIQLLLGQLAPQSGWVKQGENICALYYDQLRQQLDMSKSIQANICGESETVTINGRSRHIMGYLQDFLFTPERARMPIQYLSGGERNRLFLARLFTQTCNFLILDEPTNDLDVETLELLESLLVEFSGTVLLVSHDRAFLNNVVTSTLVLEGAGQVKEYAGGWDDYLLQRPKTVAPVAAEKKSSSNNAVKKAAPAASPTQARKLGFKEKQQLQTLPQTIDKLEAQHVSILESMQDPLFYKKPPGDIAAVKKQLAEVEEQIKAAYALWQDLESIKNQSLS